MTIRLLGVPDIRRPDGTAATGLGRRSVALLACIAASPRPWSRDDLAALLWPDRSLKQRRGSLRQELLRLRRGLGWKAEPGPAGAEGTFGLPLHLGQIDVVEFRQALTRPDGAAVAVSLYRGDLLQDVRCEPADPFGAWLAGEREALRQTALDLMLGLLRSGEASAALALRVVMIDPTHEEAHRLLMQHHADRGDLARVLEQYRACAEAL